MLERSGPVCLLVRDPLSIPSVSSSENFRALLGKITTVKYRGIYRGNW